MRGRQSFVPSRFHTSKPVSSSAAPSKGNVSSSLSHNHRRPAAALYGRPTGPSNVVHKPNAGGDHVLRKPAVHVGIPQAKIPDKNISVRCLWTNNLSVQRTVTVSQPSGAAVAVYRAPTPPPPCSTDAEYPPGCQGDLRRKLERMHMRASLSTSVFPFHFCRLY